MHRLGWFLRTALRRKGSEAEMHAELQDHLRARVEHLIGCAIRVTHYASEPIPAP